MRRSFLGKLENHSRHILERLGLRERAQAAGGRREAISHPDLPTLNTYRSVEAFCLSHVEREEEIAERARITKASVVAGGEAFHVEGYCDPCGVQADFLVDYSGGEDQRGGGGCEPNWRERLVCPCGLNNRIRAALHIFRRYCNPSASDPIYVTEQVTPLYRWLTARYDAVIGSEYLGIGVAYGETDSNGVRNESLMSLSLADDTIRFVLSFDVLEHLSDYQTALTEICRILQPGGYLLLSVPFLVQSSETLVRARVRQDGSIEHLLPPEYHGDPLSDTGCLCFYHFGWDLLERCRQAGFADAVAVGIWSRDYGHLGDEQLVFVARK